MIGNASRVKGCARLLLMWKAAFKLLSRIRIGHARASGVRDALPAQRTWNQFASDKLDFVILPAMREVIAAGAKLPGQAAVADRKRVSRKRTTPVSAEDAWMIGLYEV